jgi:hypothetical protein
VPRAACPPVFPHWQASCQWHPSVSSSVESEDRTFWRGNRILIAGHITNGQHGAPRQPA